MNTGWKNMNERYYELSGKGYLVLDSSGGLWWKTHRAEGYWPADYALLEEGISMEDFERAVEALKGEQNG